MIPNILTVAAIALCAASAALWIWSYGDVRYLLSNLFHGQFDGDRAWSGYSLNAYRGQVVFELEQIRYSTPPASAPLDDRMAEEAVGLYTMALRPFPFGNPWGFHFVSNRTVSDAGSLRVTRLAFPLWAVLVVLLLPVLYRFRTRLRWRRAPKTAPPGA